jgi:hypothetical protein
MINCIFVYMLVTDVTFYLKKNVKTIDEAIRSSMPQNVSPVSVNYNICQTSSAFGKCMRKKSKIYVCTMERISSLFPYIAVL